MFLANRSEQALLTCLCVCRAACDSCHAHGQSSSGLGSLYYSARWALELVSVGCYIDNLSLRAESDSDVRLSRIWPLVTLCQSSWQKLHAGIACAAAGCSEALVVHIVYYHSGQFASVRCSLQTAYIMVPLAACICVSACYSCCVKRLIWWLIV